jgi:hypothetical protein
MFPPVERETERGKSRAERKEPQAEYQSNNNIFIEM